MKKIVCTMLCIMLLFGLSACGGDVSEVKTHNVESESYSEEDIKAAIDTIKKEFKSDWKGCTLTEIYYAGALLCRPLEISVVSVTFLGCERASAIEFRFFCFGSW